uniref:Uncharacterized protein n=1 Tax=Spironucleus salmonicida TaxID=348837 RepID=V6M424_9EUKA|eukprot:EST48074.1 Hypothetical protein SS50377_11771 [Spironucleus salmonicida]
MQHHKLININHSNIQPLSADCNLMLNSLNYIDSAFIFAKSLRIHIIPCYSRCTTLFYTLSKNWITRISSLIAQGARSAVKSQPAQQKENGNGHYLQCLSQYLVGHLHYNTLLQSARSHDYRPPVRTHLVSQGFRIPTCIRSGTYSEQYNSQRLILW